MVDQKKNVLAILCEEGRIYGNDSLKSFSLDEDYPRKKLDTGKDEECPRHV